MKKIYTYILMIVCATMFAGCQKDFMGIFTVDVEDYEGGDGKVYIDSEKFACWNNGDDVLINGNKFQVTVNNAKTETKIAMTTGGEVDEFTAIYPAKNATYNGAKQYTLNMPQIQVYNSGLKIDAPMMAYTTKANAHLSFKNMGSLMAVTVKGITATNRPTTIAVTAMGGDKLWGEATCTYGENGPTMTMNTNKGSNTVFLEIPTVGVPLDATEIFYVVLPSGVESQVKVEVLSQNSSTNHVLKSRIRETPQAVTIGRNKIVPVELTLTADAGNYFPNAGDANQINSAMDYVAFSKEADFDLANTQNKTFTQSVDIVVPSIYSNISDFGGIYDGGGKGLTIGGENDPSWGGMFRNITLSWNDIVEIKNLTLTIHAKATVMCVMGGMVGEYNGGQGTKGMKIENCTVNGSIEVDPNAKEPLSVGTSGIIAITPMHGNVPVLAGYGYGTGGFLGGGDYEAKIIMNNCHNNAEIKGSLAYSVGGIIGQVKYCEIYNCTNTASLTGVAVGGIIGKSTSCSQYGISYIDRCVNSGVLNANTAYNEIATECTMGGIAGTLNTGFLMNSVNHGAITSGNIAGGLVGYSHYDVNTYNSYADGAISGGSVKGGVLGQAKTYYMDFYNVYTSERGGDSGKWIVGSGNSGVTCQNVYRPEGDEVSETNDGVASGVSTYTTTDYAALKSGLSIDIQRVFPSNPTTNQPYIQETWKDGANGKPMLNFEN